MRQVAEPAAFAFLLQGMQLRQQLFIVPAITSNNDQRMRLAHRVGQLLEGLQHPQQILARLQSADKQEEPGLQAMLVQDGAALLGFDALEVDRLHAQWRHADALGGDLQVLDHVLLAVFGNGDDVVGFADRGGEQPTLEAAQVVLDPLGVQHGDHVHDGRNRGHTVDSRDMVIGRMEQIDVPGNRPRVRQWKLEDAAQQRMHRVAHGQLFGRAAGHRWQVAPECIGF